MPLFFLVNSTAANAKLSDASINKLKERNKNQTPRIGQPKIHTHGLCPRLQRFRKVFKQFQAFDLIESISTKGENYNLVLDKLWVDLCSPYIKSSNFDVIYNRKNKNPDNVFRNVRDNLIAKFRQVSSLLQRKHLDQHRKIIRKINLKRWIYWPLSEKIRHC